MYVNGKIGYCIWEDILQEATWVTLGLFIVYNVI